MSEELICPYCNSREVTCHEGSYCDADGRHEFHRIRCHECGRETYDMDSHDKALEAFWYGENGDTVYQPRWAEFKSKFDLGEIVWLVLHRIDQYRVLHGVIKSIILRGDKDIYSMSYRGVTEGGNEFEVNYYKDNPEQIFKTKEEAKAHLKEVQKHGEV